MRQLWPVVIVIHIIGKNCEQNGKQNGKATQNNNR